MSERVEKCGICGEPFSFNEEASPIGMVQTEYLVPEDFIVYSYNVLSKTSESYPSGVSMICVKCADIMDECKKDPSKSTPKIKYIHDFDEDTKSYKAYDVSGFSKIDSNILEQITREIESNPLYHF